MTTDQVSCDGGALPQPGQVFSMVLGHLPADKQPTGRFVVDRVQDGYVWWQSGSRTPLELFTCEGACRWRRLA